MDAGRGSSGSTGWSGDAAVVEAAHEPPSLAAWDPRRGAACPSAPDAPVLAAVADGSRLVFSGDGSSELEVGVADDLNATAPDSWRPGDTVRLDARGESYQVAVFARAIGADCGFAHVYTVRGRFAGDINASDSTAIARDDAAFVGWATGLVEPPALTDAVGADWRDASRALGPASDDPFDVVSLGDGGHVTLRFDPPITDGSGPDFAVFENGIPGFLELAFVEVSSDGQHFERFDSAYLRNTPVGPYELQAAENIEGLAGKYRRGFGTPFDLGLLGQRQASRRGTLDLLAVTHVRIVDIPGCDPAAQGCPQRSEDSFGAAIYDPFPTNDSVGFDLDAVGVLHEKR